MVHLVVTKLAVAWLIHSLLNHRFSRGGCSVVEAGCLQSCSCLQVKILDGSRLLAELEAEKEVSNKGKARQVGRLSANCLDHEVVPPGSVIACRHIGKFIAIHMQV